MRSICGAGIALIIAGVGSAARAETTVSVLGIQNNDAPADVATKLAAALRRRVESAPGQKLIKGKNLDEIKLVFGCVDEQPECMARVGRNLQADKLLWGTLRVSGAGYVLSLRFLDVAAQRLEHSIEQPLTKADAARPTETIEQLTTPMFPVPPGAIRIGSNVAGAEIFLGEAPRGRTGQEPVLLPAVPPGDHSVSVRKKGYRSWQGAVTVVQGQTAELEVRLEAVAGIVPPPPRPAHRPPPRRRPPRKDPRSGWKIAFWSTAALAVGLGVGVAVTGISVLDLEDDKETEIKYLLNSPDVALSRDVEEALTVGDACSTGSEGSPKLKGICDDGATRAGLVNGLIAGGAVTAAVAAFFLYKAYIERRSDERTERDDGDDADEEARSPVRLITGASPDGAHVGLSISF